jgi:hypothetical protein
LGGFVLSKYAFAKVSDQTEMSLDVVLKPAFAKACDTLVEPLKPSSTFSTSI